MVLLLFSAIVRWVLWPLSFVVSLFSDRMREQLMGRPKINTATIELARRRRGFDDCVVFFCSSAGEYEQAKPIIDRISKDENILCHVFFFSVSGMQFIKARGDDVSWTLSPPDHVWAWGSLFAALRPSKTIIIRHEVWPAFVSIASQWGPVVVVDAVVPSLWGRQAKWKQSLNLAIKAWLLRSVDKIFVVSRTDQEFFERWLKIPASKILVTGDTKYDRVIERAAQKRKTVEGLRQVFKESWRPEGCELSLIGGSVHLPDVQLILDAFSHESLHHVKILLVPHDVSSGNIGRIFEAVKNAKFSCELLSEVEASSFKFLGSHPRIILADEMGRLSDLYGVADFAWIGGAVHAKVHNILEPAAWGLPISCGSNFQNSQEAIALHNAQLLFTTSDSTKLRQYWVEKISQLDALGVKTHAFAKSMSGASDAVISSIFKATQK
jgi:3-deoxy-D-manno-octulosonic-acid transferase